MLPSRASSTSLRMIEPLFVNCKFIDKDPFGDNPIAPQLCMVDPHDVDWCATWLTKGAKTAVNPSQ